VPSRPDHLAIDPSPAPAERDTVVRLRRQFRSAVVIETERGLAGRTLWLALCRLGHVGLAVAVAAASWQALQASLAAGLLGLPLAWILIGSRFRALGNMMHECAHRSFVRSRRWNRIFGHLLSFVDFTDFAEYTHEHFTHHAQLGADGDLDARPRRALFAALGPFDRRYLRYGLTLRHLRHYIRPIFFSRRDSLAVGLARLGFNASLLAGAHFVVGWPCFLLYYAVPYLTAYQIFRFLSDAADHGGILAERDELDRSRNHIHRWGWVNWLAFPAADQYHLVHHIFPGVPTPSLARVHGILLASPLYAAREHDLTRLLRGPAR
jgi:fatty acid desaturase